MILREKTLRTFNNASSLTFSALLCLLLLARSAQATEAVGQPTFDGRFGSKCLAWERDNAREICQVSFFKLIATPESYDRKMIAVTGYLVKVFGRNVLFASKERFDADLQLEGIEVDTSDLPKELEGEVAKGAYPVLVIGTFDARYVGADVPRLGIIRNAVSVQSLKGMPKS